MKAWPIIAALAILAGCQNNSSSAPAPEPKAEKESVEATAKAQDLIDFREGTQWVYALEATARTKEGDQATTGEFTMKIEKLARPTGGQSAEIQTTAVGENEKTLRKIKWLLSEEGLFQVADNDLKDVFDPPMPLLPATLKAGEKIGWKGAGPRIDGTKGPTDVAIKVIGLEEVDTLMGPMSAWSVESAAVWKEDGEEFRVLTTTWWSPKVGLVRMIRELDTPEYGLKSMLRLKSHTVKE